MTELTNRTRRRRGGAGRTAGLGVLGLALCLPALAAAQTGAESDIRPYVTGRLGYANSEFLLDEPYHGRVDDGSVAYGIALGAEFGEYLGVEFAATGYGDFEGQATPCPIGQVCSQVVRETTDNDVRTITAALAPHVNLGRIDFIGRIGYYRARIDTETRLGGSEFTERGLLLGAGARWNFEDRPWIVSVEAARFDDNLYQFMVGVGWQPAILGQ